MERSTTPTGEFYGFLQCAYDLFNQRLFGGNLPACLLTVQREKKTMGYFSAQRWSNPAGRQVHEISLNPVHFANHRLIEVLQTLVHEMSHLWQHEFGKASVRTYHNRGWAEKMESIGLMPSATGRPGGKKTGQNMMDYPIKEGGFSKACVALLQEGHQLPWVDRFPAPASVPLDSIAWMEEASGSIESPDTTAEPVTDRDDSEERLLLMLGTPVSTIMPNLASETEVRQAAKTKQKARYTCNSCAINVWGKVGLKLICGECGSPFESNLQA